MTDYRVYVIELEKSVVENDKFSRENPDYQNGKPCVYVGSTAATPERRFEQHLSDRIRGSSWVRNYGEELLGHAYEDLPWFDSRVAVEDHEASYAETLRSKGWGVWQR